MKFKPQIIGLLAGMGIAAILVILFVWLDSRWKQEIPEPSPRSTPKILGWLETDDTLITGDVTRQMLIGVGADGSLWWKAGKEVAKKDKTVTPAPKNPDTPTTPETNKPEPPKK